MRGSKPGDNLGDDAMLQGVGVVVVVAQHRFSAPCYKTLSQLPWKTGIFHSKLRYEFILSENKLNLFLMAQLI